MTKLFAAAFLTETADLQFTPISITREGWEIARHGDYGTKPSKFAELLLVFRDMAEAKSWEVAEGPCAVGFPPGGRIVRSVYEDIRAMILEDLQQAMPVDVVLLQLHGAAMAHGYDDCEGDLLEHIRVITGPDIPIGVELDPHCHISGKMMNNSTAIILYKTFAHTDTKERAVELFNLIADTLAGKVKPVMALFDCRIVDSFDDESEPVVKGLLESVVEGERLEGILSISPVHGYPLANIPDMGTKMLVIADKDIELAREVAEEFGLAYSESRGRLDKFGDINSPLNEAQERAAKGEQITLVDWGDCVGVGFPCDGTEILQVMLQRGMTDVVVGMVWEPLAVSICHDVGVGAELNLRIGGKVSLASGAPLDLNVIVERIYRDVVINNWEDDVTPCDAAVVRCGETQLCLVSKRFLPSGLQALRDLGVEPSNKQYLLTKYVADLNNDDESREGRHIIHIFGSTLNYKHWPAARITRPKWPWDENPFSQMACSASNADSSQ
jgi:microcystin degradation protein MlrC